MHTKRKQLIYRIIFFLVTTAYVVLTVVCFVQMLAHHWGMNYKDEGEGASIELMIIGIAGFILLFVYGVAQALFIINSMMTKHSAIFDGLCYRERDRLTNKLTVSVTSVLGAIAGGVGLWFYITGFLPTLNGQMPYAGLSDWGNELFLLMVMFCLIIFIDCVAILIYMVTFRRDYLIGNIIIPEPKPNDR